MAEKKRFKLAFRKIMCDGPSGLTPMRALVIAVAAVPGQPLWLQAVLALEDGNMMSKTIPKWSFEQAARDEVTLVEVDGEAAPDVLYDPKGAAS